MTGLLPHLRRELHQLECDRTNGREVPDEDMAEVARQIEVLEQRAERLKETA